jgi:hypothetical protein
VGNFYDKERGFEVFTPTAKQKRSVYLFFDDCCAYCGHGLDADNATLDHLIPLNRTALGLHAWGNVIACCRFCNKEKHFKDWLRFLQTKSGEEFVSHYKYDPELGLHVIAHNLYQDIGEVGMTLVRLRLKQAESVIRTVVTRKSSE